MTPAPRVQRRKSSLRNDSGAASVELAVLFPLALLLMLSVLQAGLWWHTRSLCLHAAWHGATAARTTTGTTTSARETAAAFLARGPSAAARPEVDASATGEEVTVRVSASAPRVLPLPGVEFRTEQLARAPRERFLPGRAP